MCDDEHNVMDLWRRNIQKLACYIDDTLPVLGLILAEMWKWHRALAWWAMCRWVCASCVPSWEGNSSLCATREEDRRLPRRRCFRWWIDWLSKAHERNRDEEKNCVIPWYCKVFLVRSDWPALSVPPEHAGSCPYFLPVRAGWSWRSGCSQRSVPQADCPPAAGSPTTTCKLHPHRMSAKHCRPNPYKEMEHNCLTYTWM